MARPRLVTGAPAQGSTAAEAAVRDLLGQDVFERVARPTAEARGLPNPAFTDEAFFALERERIFARSWVLAGFARDIPEPGDVLPVEVAGRPVLLLRDREGRVRAFHNVCRHRGTRLVDAPCRGRRNIVCPYHAWSYGLDGRLTGRPYFAGREARSQDLAGAGDIALAPVRIARWLDLVFVDLSGEAPDLEDLMRPMTGALAGHDLSALRHAATLDFEVAANWKFACENFAENYHVFAAHPRLTRFVPMEKRNPGRFEGACFMNAYEIPALEPGRGADLPHYPGLSEADRRRGLWFLLFPTLGVEVFPDQLAVFQVVPLSAGRCRERLHVYLMDEAVESAAHAEARQAVIDTWHDLNLEDVTLLEGLQAGRASPAYDGGLFSPQWEEPTHQFAQLVLETLRSDSP